MACRPVHDDGLVPGETAPVTAPSSSLIAATLCSSRRVLVRLISRGEDIAGILE